MTGADGVRNMLRMYDRASFTELHHAVGSYQRYHDLLREISRPLAIMEFRHVVGIFAALSPNNNYIQNLKDTRHTINALCLGKGLSDFTVCTYDNNKEKAWRIAQGAEPLDLIVARKTRSFYGNLLDPSDPQPVTVDGHLYWIWQGRRGVVKTRDADRKETAPPSLNAKLYEEISDAVRLTAELKGVIPCQAQAVLWQTYRRVHGIMKANQGELIASDCAAAGVPDHALAFSGGCGL